MIFDYVELRELIKKYPEDLKSFLNKLDISEEKFIPEDNKYLEGLEDRIDSKFKLLVKENTVTGGLNILLEIEGSENAPGNISIDLLLEKVVNNKKKILEASRRYKA